MLIYDEGIQDILRISELVQLEDKFVIEKFAASRRAESNKPYSVKLGLHVQLL